MKRIQRICKLSAVGCVLWLAAMQLPLPWSAHLLVVLAPLLLLVAFGMYMLVLLIYGALTFRSCPEEARALHDDICRARDDLLARGYIFSEGLNPDRGGVKQRNHPGLPEHHSAQAYVRIAPAFQCLQCSRRLGAGQPLATKTAHVPLSALAEAPAIAVPGTPHKCIVAHPQQSKKLKCTILPSRQSDSCRQKKLSGVVCRSGRTGSSTVQSATALLLGHSSY